MDKRVIDIHPFLRFLLVQGIIVSFCFQSRLGKLQLVESLKDSSYFIRALREMIEKEPVIAEL